MFSRQPDQPSRESTGLIDLFLARLKRHAVTRCPLEHDVRRATWTVSLFLDCYNVLNDAVPVRIGHAEHQGSLSALPGGVEMATACGIDRRFRIGCRNAWVRAPAPARLMFPKTARARRRVRRRADGPANEHMDPGHPMHFSQVGFVGCPVYRCMDSFESLFLPLSMRRFLQGRWWGIANWPYDPGEQ